MKKWLIGLICLLAGEWAVYAQDKMEIKFRSRALLDATVSGYGKEDVQGYYRVEDFRLGFKALYGKYELKADVGLGGGKVAIKDLLFNYHFPHSVLSLGNTYEPFSMDMLISTADLRFHQSATSVLAFTDSRKLGATWHYYTDACYLATGIYTNNDINKLGSEQKNSFVSTSRAVWRRKNSDCHLIHLGGAFSFRTKDVNQISSPAGSISSDGVTSMFQIPLLEAEIPDMNTQWKGILEFLYTTSRFMIQTEYFYNRMNRTNGQKAYRSHGGYVQGGFLIKGTGFDYDMMYGIPGRPSTSQAIELVARFNYSNLNDKNSEIKGGEEKDLSLGVNFYLNQYLGVKLNGSYVWVGDHCNAFYKKNFFLTQLRLQYIF
ncbi:porin [Phocaeicola acetigenes]|jgi:phosphate-selective porin OprO/OprP|uniref:Porin n=1 Tax=Phocaeicola acetigenes TaxID=3016083 RepID=A0ABT4PHV9_9BACT|nr:porin [Phocaeicola sp. KGMB11183]MCZ8372652.1 porin [Phocaeicola sp. KGMB11183]